MPDDAIDRLQEIAGQLQAKQVEQLQALPRSTRPMPSGPADPRHFDADGPVLESVGAPVGASTSAGVSIVPNVSVDLSAPNTLDARTRSWMAKAMVVLAIIGLGVGIAGLVIGDAGTDPGSLPVLCVVVAMIAAVGAVIITLGYGSVKLGTGTNTPVGSSAGSTTPP